GNSQQFLLTEFDYAYENKANCSRAFNCCRWHHAGPATPDQRATAPPDSGFAHATGAGAVCPSFSTRQRQRRTGTFAAGHAELIRLRSEVAELKTRVTGLPNALKEEDRMRLTKVANELEEGKVLLAKSPDIPMVASHQWTNVGFATPAAALQT